MSSILIPSSEIYKMGYNDFLDSIINQGIASAKRDYVAGEKLDGAIAGFEACRNKTYEEIVDILEEVNEYLITAQRECTSNYWFFRCYQAEVIFVLKSLQNNPFFKI